MTTKLTVILFAMCIVGGLLTGGCSTMKQNVPIQKQQEPAVATVGLPAPRFSLPDQDLVIHNLSDYADKKVVLYFYPKDDTPGCTKQACSFRDWHKDLSDKGIVVIGISYDTPEKHKRFIQTHKLPFLLLSDCTKEVAKKYGAQGWFLPKRMTFLIDEKGVIIHVFEKVDIAQQIDSITQIYTKNDAAA